MGIIAQEALNGRASTYGYDDLSCRASATISLTGTNYARSFDNADSHTHRVALGVTTTYTYNAADQLTGVNGATVTSDLDGNVTNDAVGRVYTWGARSRLTGLTKNGNSYVFKYGPDNLRTYKSVNGIVTQYMLDGEQVVTEKISGVANQTLYGSGTDHPLARNGEFFLPNRASSTTTLTDGSGTVVQSYAYYPFGQLISGTTDSNPFLYTGREDDGDSLIYYRARYYNPNWGRFISADPLSVGGVTDFAAGPSTHQPALTSGMDQGAGWMLNPYIYCSDNPVSDTDPTGLISPRQWVWIGVQVIRVFLNSYPFGTPFIRPSDHPVEVITSPGPSPSPVAPMPPGVPSPPAPTAPVPPEAPPPGDPPTPPAAPPENPTGFPRWRRFTGGAGGYGGLAAGLRIGWIFTTLEIGQIELQAGSQAVGGYANKVNAYSRWSDPENVP